LPAAISGHVVVVSTAEEAPVDDSEQPEEAPEPHEMFARTRAEGKRRLQRSKLELATTSLVAGFDVVFGVIALASATAAMAPHFGPEAGHFFGSLAFGIAFIFIVVSSKGVLPQGAAPALVDVAETIGEHTASSAFLSAIAGGALITGMTWMVEGVGTVGGRIVVAWIAGVLLALGSFNHVIVVTLELIFGMRFGADVGIGDIGLNFAIAAAGNMIGGMIFVTLTRTSQAIGSGDSDTPTH
jgi:formate/nitrite transporter FocA (FNT family)